MYSESCISFSLQLLVAKIVMLIFMKPKKCWWQKNFFVKGKLSEKILKKTILEKKKNKVAGFHFSIKWAKFYKKNNLLSSYLRLSLGGSSYRVLPILSSCAVTKFTNRSNIRAVSMVGCYNLIINRVLLTVYWNSKKLNVSKFGHINSDCFKLLNNSNNKKKWVGCLNFKNEHQHLVMYFL